MLEPPFARSRCYAMPVARAVSTGALVHPEHATADAPDASAQKVLDACAPLEDNRRVGAIPWTTMLKFVRAIDRLLAAETLVGRGALAEQLASQFEQRVFWIGFEPLESPLRSAPVPQRIFAQLDVTHPDDAIEGDHRIVVHRRRAPSPALAQSIACAVQPIVAHSDPWAIVVHCTAGISRSAAVAFWLQSRFAIHDRDEFAARHAHCRPNRTLLRLLGAGAV